MTKNILNDNKFAFSEFNNKLSKELKLNLDKNLKNHWLTGFSDTTASFQIKFVNKSHPKRELIHYTWRKRDKTSSYINLTNHDSTISTILVGSTICWLEVYFNCKLLYNYYITKMVVKAKNTIVYISMLANTVQSLSHYYLRLFYCTYILPIIIYASTA